MPSPLEESVSDRDRFRCRHDSADFRQNWWNRARERNLTLYQQFSKGKRGANPFARVNRLAH
jgi:hypothetical protein